MNPSDELLAKMPVDARLSETVALIRADDFFSSVPVFAPLPGGITAELVNSLAKLGVFVRLQIESGEVMMPARKHKVSILIEEATTLNRKEGQAFKTALDLCERLLCVTLNPAFARQPVADGPDGLSIVPTSYRMLAHDATKLAYEITATLNDLVEISTD